MKNRFKLIIAFMLALAISGGVYAYAYTTASGTIGIAEPTGDFAICNDTEIQPDWDSILDNLLSENKTSGEVPTGDLFDISPIAGYSGDLVVKAFLTTTGNLTKAYQYLNIKLYLENSVEAVETPDYRLLTLDNGVATFNIESGALELTSENWTQTSQTDFEAGTLYQVDTTTSPGDVLLDYFADNVTDTFYDESKIAYSENLTFSFGQGQVTLGPQGIETYRPNATGDVTGIDNQYPSSGVHWDKVDEATADNWSTYVYTNSTSYQRDLYNIPDHTIGTQSVDNVTLYFDLATTASTTSAIVYEGPNLDGFLKTVQIATDGLITDTATDTLEFDDTDGSVPKIINVSGNIYAIVYEGPLGDGFLKTVEMTSTGNVTDTVIDTLEFDTLDGHDPDITHVSGDVYAIAYAGVLGDGFLKTVEITSTGNITDTVIDTLEFDTSDGNKPNITHVSGDVYAIVYTGKQGDGFLITVDIATNGQITDTIIDTLEFDTLDGITPHIIHVSSNVYAIAYEGVGGDGFLKTVEIATNGQITDTVIDTLEFDTLDGITPHIIHVSGNVYTIAYEGVGLDGFLITVEIATNGQITDTVIDTLEFDTVDGHDPSITGISGNVYAIAYEGVLGDGFLITVEIAANGQITDTIIDTLEFDTVDGHTPHILFIPRICADVHGRAVIKTHDTIYTGSEESVTSDTFITKSYSWITNPNTGDNWTWSEINALQIGIDLKTDDSFDFAACSQIYMVVSFTGYHPMGELISINLLSGEAVISIDSFSYDIDIPTGTSVDVQFSQDNTNWYDSAGTPGGWDALSDGTHAIDLSGLGWSGPNFYYRMKFTTDTTDTPCLYEIAVNFFTYYTSGTLTSLKYDTQGLSDFSTVSFTISEPASTDIKFQIRTAASSAGLDSAAWYGPTGTDDYYTISSTAVNSVHDNDRWIQYKAFFSDSGTATPTLSDITISYENYSFNALSVIGGSYYLATDDSSQWGSGWSTIPEIHCEVTQR